MNQHQFLFKAFFSVVLSCATLAQAAPTEVDRIVAIVNSESITSSQLRARVDGVRKNLQNQGLAEQMPPRDVLERQILEQLVMERIQLQQARNASIQVNDSMIDRAINVVAGNNSLTLDQLRTAVTNSGLAWNKYREEVRTELMLGRLREIDVDSKVTVSDAEVNNFVRNHPEVLLGTEYRVAHIVLRIPENMDEQKLKELQARADRVLSRLQAGEDFAKIAADSSDTPDNVKGGELGWLDRERLPGFYADVVSKLRPGEISPPLQSSAGLHVIKLLDKRERNNTAAQQVEQTHARHILLKVSELLSDAEAQARLNALRERIVNGADFAELARANSADLSAARGGDIGWVNPGDTVPEFEKAMNALAPNQVSEPVRSPFGWHLVQVLERRKQDMGEEYHRNIARNILRQRKANEAYEDWLRQLRDEAYVEYKLEDAHE
ncbi:MAG: peptidylprolyl isomerase [Azoarcus sp.]|jgi:peptidyl-prolyl cis-trans isomerase SurA|nr:peptidylprolyl isomerase [Azoarcus sp.]